MHVHIFIIICDHDNVVVDKTFFSLLCIRLEILKNIDRDIIVVTLSCILSMNLKK